MGFIAVALAVITCTSTTRPACMLIITNNIDADDDAAQT